jgi:hypothetical protein
MNQNQSSMQAPMQAPIQASMQTPTQPQFVIQPQQPGQSGWDKAMGYSASCGKFVGLSTAVISVILIIIFCWVGIYFYRKKSTVVYDKVSATITEANCTQQITDTGRNRNVTYKCSLKVKYTVNNTEYENTVVSGDGVHNIGEVVSIYYNVENPNNVVYSYISNKNLGKILIGVGSSVVLLFVIHIVLTMKSKWYNRLQCIGAVSSTVSSAFRY